MSWSSYFHAVPSEVGIRNTSPEMQQKKRLCWASTFLASLSISNIRLNVFGQAIIKCCLRWSPGVGEKTQGTQIHTLVSAGQWATSQLMWICTVRWMEQWNLPGNAVLPLRPTVSGAFLSGDGELGRAAGTVPSEANRTRIQRGEGVWASVQGTSGQLAVLYLLVEGPQSAKNTAVTCVAVKLHWPTSKEFKGLAFNEGMQVVPQFSCQL